MQFKKLYIRWAYFFEFQLFYYQKFPGKENVFVLTGGNSAFLVYVTQNLL